MQLPLRIACWNVLADCYFTPTSSYHSSWTQRRNQIEYILRSLTSLHTKIILLQEIDHLEDFYYPLLSSLGFKYLYLQRPEKEDGCLLAYSQDDYVLVNSESVFFDDLVDDNSGSSSCFNSSKAFRRTTFLRNNVAIIAHLRNINHMCDNINKAKEIIVAVPHIYWNPAFPEVKEGQVMYLLDRVASFRVAHVKPDSDVSEDIVPLVIGGDFNSLPDSGVYQLLSQPFQWQLLEMHAKANSNATANINATKEIEDTETRMIKGEDSNPGKSNDANFTFSLNVQMRDRYIKPSDNKPGRSNQTGHRPRVTFLCDSSLSKFCRWLRVLGISCAMYQPPQRGQGAAQQPYDYAHLFAQARSEGRVLLTSGRKTLERANCPESFLVNTKCLEESLVSLFSLYSIALDASRFLTVCGKCGGDVVTCHSEDYKTFTAVKIQRTMKYRDSLISSELSQENNSLRNPTNDSNYASEEAAVWVPEDREIFMCTDCLQPYWWSESESSSPARAMQLAYRLHHLVSRSLPGAITPLREAPSEKYDSGKELTMVELKDLFDRRDASVLSLSQRKHTQLLSEHPLSCEDSDPTVTDHSRSEVNSFDEITEAEISNLMDYSSSSSSSSSSMLSEQHTLRLSSALACRHGVEPPYSNWTETFKGTLDYLFVSTRAAGSHHDDSKAALEVSDSRLIGSSSCLKLMQENCSERSDPSLPLSDAPPSKSFTYDDLPDGPFPNEQWPSDHIMILADLLI